MVNFENKWGLVGKVKRMGLFKKGVSYRLKFCTVTPFINYRYVILQLKTLIHHKFVSFWYLNVFISFNLQNLIFDKTWR